MIRAYKEDDKEILVEIWRAATEIATPFLPADFIAGEPDNIRNLYLPNAETWVYETAESVVGFIALIGNEVGAIFVHPIVQGQGVGRALMDHAASLRDSLCLDVFKENAIGRRFYDRYGFQLENEHVHEPTGHLLVHLVLLTDQMTT